MNDGVRNCVRVTVSGRYIRERLAALLDFPHCALFLTDHYPLPQHGETIPWNYFLSHHDHHLRHPQLADRINSDDVSTSLVRVSVIIPFLIVLPPFTSSLFAFVSISFISTLMPCVAENRRVSLKVAPIWPVVGNAPRRHQDFHQFLYPGNKFVFAKQDKSGSWTNCVLQSKTFPAKLDPAFLWSMFAANGGRTNADEKGKLVSHLWPDPNSFLMKTHPISEMAVSAFRASVEATIRSNRLWVELDPSTSINITSWVMTPWITYPVAFLLPEADWVAIWCCFSLNLFSLYKSWFISHLELENFGNNVFKISTKLLSFGPWGCLTSSWH